jgi:hypothetical protein
MLRLAPLRGNGEFAGVASDPLAFAATKTERAAKARKREGRREEERELNLYSSRIRGACSLPAQKGVNAQKGVRYPY